jgi:hypothetical protein
MLAPWSAAYTLYDSKAAMAIRDMDGGWRPRILISGLVPPCSLIAVLKRHGEGSGLSVSFFFGKLSRCKHVDVLIDRCVYPMHVQICIHM